MSAHRRPHFWSATRRTSRMEVLVAMVPASLGSALVVTASAWGLSIQADRPVPLRHLWLVAVATVLLTSVLFVWQFRHHLAPPDGLSHRILTGAEPLVRVRGRWWRRVRCDDAPAEYKLLCRVVPFRPRGTFDHKPVADVPAATLATWSEADGRLALRRRLG